MDRASLDPKVLSGQKPERSALHRCRYRIGCECGTRRFGRFANRGGAWLYRVRDRPKAEHESIQRDVDSMNLRSSVALAAMLAAHPTAAQDHRFETDPVVTVRENFVACDVLSQLQRVMDNPRFLLIGECEPLSAGRRVRIYASRGPYVCIYPEDTITPCKWTHEKVLSK